MNGTLYSNNDGSTSAALNSKNYNQQSRNITNTTKYSQLPLKALTTTTDDGIYNNTFEKGESIMRNNTNVE